MNPTWKHTSLLSEASAFRFYQPWNCCDQHAPFTTGWSVIPVEKDSLPCGGTKLYHPFCHTDLMKGEYPVTHFLLCFQTTLQGEKNSIFKLCHLAILTWQTICRCGKTLSLSCCEHHVRSHFLTQYMSRFSASKFSLLFLTDRLTRFPFFPAFNPMKCAVLWNTITYY